MEKIGPKGNQYRLNGTGQEFFVHDNMNNTRTMGLWRIVNCAINDMVLSYKRPKLCLDMVWNPSFMRTMDKNKKMKNKADTFLIFTGNAEAAMNFYAALFENSSIDLMVKYTPKESGKAGVKKGILRLNGQEFICCDQTNDPTPISTDLTVICVECKSEKDLKTKRNALAEGGQILAPLENYNSNRSSVKVRDKFGLLWQLAFTDGDKKSEDLNLCFANNKEVRPEYKL